VFDVEGAYKQVLEVRPMLVPFEQDAVQIQLATASRALESCNQAIGRYGLSLSAQDVRALVAGRLEALQTTERVEFGGDVTKQLVLAFASSPYVSQPTFAETVLELQDLFYEFKNESLEQIPDDELIATMRSLFDEVANGDLDYLAEALFEGLGRHIREEDAAMNGLMLAHHRYDVSRWVDETYAPAWEGASWLDE
jgi:hypothetical protein